MAIRLPGCLLLACVLAAGDAAPAGFRAIPCNQPGHLGFVYEAVVGQERIAVPFALFLPAGHQDQPQRRWPLIVFLHGAGEGGTDLGGIFAHGPSAEVVRNERMRAGFPCLICSPQTTRGWDRPMLQAVVAAVRAVAVAWRADADRISATGLSMGGLGTWNLVAEAPDLFAAAMPISAKVHAEPEALAPRLRGCAVWTIVGADDSGDFVTGAKTMHAALRVTGVDSQLTIIPGVGHFAWALYYNNPELYRWLLVQRRAGPAARRQADALWALHREDNGLAPAGGAEAQAPGTVDAAQLRPGWDAVWFADAELKQPLQRRVEAKIDYPDGKFALTGDRSENLSARWSGWISVPAAGTYTFWTASDDGQRLSVGDTRIIDDWNGHGVTEQRSRVRLAAGMHRITIEYFQGGGGAGMSAWWAGPGFERRLLAAPEVRHLPP